MTLEDLEKKTRVFEDVEDIKKLHRQYAYWVNAHLGLYQIEGNQDRKYIACVAS